MIHATKALNIEGNTKVGLGLDFGANPCCVLYAVIYKTFQINLDFFSTAKGM